MAQSHELSDDQVWGNAELSDDQVWGSGGFVPPSPPTEVRAAPEQMTGPGRLPAMAGGALMHGLAVGLGLPGNIETLAAGHGLDPLARLAPKGGFAGFFPTSDELLDLFGQTNLMDRANLVPQTGVERALTAGAQGVGAAAPLLPFGGPSAVVPTLGAGGAGSLAAQAVHEVFPQSPGLATVAGTVAGPLAAGAATLAGRTAQALAGVRNPIGRDFALAGLPIRSAALTTEREGTRRALGAGAPIEATNQDIGNRVEALAGGHGPERTLQEAGASVQEGARDWLANVMPKRLGALRAGTDAVVASDTPVSINNFASALDSINSKSGALKPITDLLTPSLPRRLQEMLAKTGFRTGEGMTPAELSYRSALLPPIQQPTWAEMRELRTAIGDAMSNPQVIKDIPAQQLSRLYAAVTEDLRGATQALDARVPAAGATARFDNENANAAKLYQFAEGTVSKLVSGKIKSADDPIPEVVARRLLTGGKAGGSDLAALQAEIPSAARALAAAHLRQSGLDEASEIGSTVAKNFSAKWTGLSPEAKAALYPDPAEREQIDALARVQEHAKAVARIGKPNALYEAAKGGMVGTALGVLAPRVLGMHGVDDITAGALGELLGTATPAIARRTAAWAGGAPLFGHLAATPAPKYGLPLQLPLAAGMGAGNVLFPPKARGQ